MKVTVSRAATFVNNGVKIKCLIMHCVLQCSKQEMPFLSVLIH